MDTWVNLLIQVPLVGIFVWFSLRQQESFQRDQTRRDTEWRDFLREQREANNQALGRIAEEVKTVATQLSSVQSLMVSHDQAVRMSIPEMAAAREKLKKLEGD
jgi:hypothetical protein